MSLDLPEQPFPQKQAFSQEQTLPQEQTLTHDQLYVLQQILKQQEMLIQMLVQQQKYMLKQIYMLHQQQKQQQKQEKYDREIGHNEFCKEIKKLKNELRRYQQQQQQEKHDCEIDYNELWKKIKILDNELWCYQQETQKLQKLQGRVERLDMLVLINQRDYVWRFYSTEEEKWYYMTTDFQEKFDEFYKNYNDRAENCKDIGSYYEVNFDDMSLLSDGEYCRLELVKSDTLQELCE